jgi:hypothetical protein
MKTVTAFNQFDAISLHAPVNNIWKRIQTLYPSEELGDVSPQSVLVKYVKGQAFPYHFDFRRLQDTNQLVSTFVFYLNTVTEAEGGALYFPRLGVRVQPKQGSVVFWFNTDLSGMKCYDITLHCSELVTGDTPKYALVIHPRRQVSGLPSC